MRTAFGQPPKAEVVNSSTIVAPIGGLNTLDPISAMPEQDAIVLRNFFPDSYGCSVRKGYVQHAIGLTGAIGALMRYSPTSGSRQLFAVDSTHVWDVTAGGDFTAGTPLCASTNSAWESTNVSNSAGVHLIAFNATDDGIWYHNGTLKRLVLGDGVVDATWKNIDPKLLISPVVHQRRLWAIQKNSNLAWYLPPEQLYGVAESFDFTSNFNRGGFLQALTNYTVDSGFGPEDLLCAISSSGEVAVYKGIDPSDPQAWALVGVFYVGSTFTRRCVCKFGGDVAILTQLGLVTMNSVMQPDPDSVVGNALSKKIQPLLSKLVTEGAARTGWAITPYLPENLLLINVPGVDLSQNFQLIYNTLTKAWTIFEGMLAQAWLGIYESLIFGGNGKVYRALEGYLDDVDIAGENGKSIVAEAQQAFNYFDMRGALKHYKMLRPSFIYDRTFQYKAGANMDFDLKTLPVPSPAVIPYVGRWDIDQWNSGAVWGGGTNSDKKWVSVVGVGYAASLRLAADTSSSLLWVSTDWIYEKGGMI